MTRAQQRRAEQRMGWVTLIAAAVLVCYWTIYLADPALLVGDDPVSRAFESAFPIADGAFAALLLGASRCLLAHRCQGALLLVAAGTAAMYLGVLDVTFYASRGLYASPSPAAMVELTVNALCLGGGALAVRTGWILWRSA